VTPTTLLELFISSSYASYVDAEKKEARFDSKSFIELLNTTKSMFDSKLVTTDHNPYYTNMFEMLNLNQYEDMIYVHQMMYDGNSAYYHVPNGSELQGTAFSSDLPVAINSKSKNIAEAWAFLKLLLSEELQTTKELGGFAVNKLAGAARMEQLLKQNDSGKPRLSLRMEGGKDYTTQPVKQADIDLITKFLEGVGYYAEKDLAVLNIVTTQAAAFFNGQKTAEETAKGIQGKVHTYLNE
jgi:multiple sugar transport system substrate-binding protein